VRGDRGIIFREKTSGMVKKAIKRCRREDMDYILYLGLRAGIRGER
jgi:hypothetical protein